MTNYYTPPPAPRSALPKIVLIGLIVGFTAAVGLGVTATLGTTDTTSAPRATTSTTSALSVWGDRIATDLELINDDMEDIESAANDYETFLLRLACRSLHADTARARTHLPAPNARVTTELAAAFDDFEEAATLCTDGAGPAGPIPSLLTRAATKLASGAEHMTNAATALGSYTNT